MAFRLLAALALAAALPALADSDRMDVQYYVVHGASLADLRSQLSSLGPTGDDGARHFGYTNNEITWHFDLVLDHGICKVQSVEVNLATHMLLPQWSPPQDPEPALFEIWGQLLRALRHHEDGHRELGVEAVREIRRRMHAATPEYSCETLTNQLNFTGNDVLREFRAKHAAYDRDTDSGRTQGVELPRTLSSATGGR